MWHLRCDAKEERLPSTITYPPQSLPARADLFAILKTTEKLERAWTQDVISAADYEAACAKLIAQFKTLWGTLRDTVNA